MKILASLILESDNNNNYYNSLIYKEGQHYFYFSEVIGLVVAFVIMLVALIAVSGVFMAWFCKQHHQNMCKKKAQSCKNIIITILMNKQYYEPLTNCCSVCSIYLQMIIHQLKRSWYKILYTLSPCTIRLGGRQKLRSPLCPPLPLTPKASTLLPSLVLQPHCSPLTTHTMDRSSSMMVRTLYTRTYIHTQQHIHTYTHSYKGNCSQHSSSP